MLTYPFSATSFLASPSSSSETPLFDLLKKGRKIPKPFLSLPSPLLSPQSPLYEDINGSLMCDDESRFPLVNMCVRVWCECGGSAFQYESRFPLVNMLRSLNDRYIFVPNPLARLLSSFHRQCPPCGGRAFYIVYGDKL